MQLFKPKPPVDLDEFEWLLACFFWLHRELGNPETSGGFVPILARPDTPEILNAQNATELFEAIKCLAGMRDWQCELEQGEPSRELNNLNLHGYFSDSRALGTFSIEGNTPVVRYDPALLKNPEALAATFAHELAHLIGYGLGDPPGGEALHEHATDCIAVYLGFGTFLANSARQFGQFQDAWSAGWHSSTSGYLSERALVTLTSMFVRLFGIDPERAAEPLKPYLRQDFGKALKYLDWRYPDFVKALDEVDLADWE